jgi:uncharacterized protein YbjT (DUF2867 family)
LRGAPNVAATDPAVKAGVKHIVFMAAVGTRQEEEPVRGASCWRGEQHLVAPAPAWTILRMNFYAESFLQLALAAGRPSPPRRACCGAEISFGLKICNGSLRPRPRGDQPS